MHRDACFCVSPTPSISERIGMLQSSRLMYSNVLDLALSYVALLVLAVVVYPVLNQRLLELGS